MSKRFFLFVFITAGILTATCIPARIVFAQADFNAYHGSPIPDSQIDGVIGSEWNDAGSYTNLTINPYGIAHLWVKQDGTYLYMGLRFYADSNNPWVAFQLGSSYCMSPTADGALFGDDNFAPNGYRDVHFEDGPVVLSDAVQNGIGAISVNASNLVIVEFKKPLNDGDVAGKDINWTQGNSYSFLIMWNSAGLGSNGGIQVHNETLPIARTIFVDPSPIPEFSSGPFFLILVAIALPVSILIIGMLKRRQNRSPK